MTAAARQIEMVRSARAYAQAGFRVIPLHEPAPDGGCSCGREECHSPGKHPRVKDWPKAATKDRDQIDAWWAKWPTANIGIATGADVAVLDVDDRHGGDQALADLVRQHGGLGQTLCAATGGGGVHYYFEADRVPCSAGKVGPGLDVKGEGGYVVAPPSLHASGQRYAWRDGTDPRTTPRARMPLWLDEAARGSPKIRERNAKHEATGEPLFVQGERNTRMFALAASLRHKGLSQEAIRAALGVENQRRCRPPLSDVEIASISTSAARYEQGAQSDGQNHRFEPVNIWVKLQPIPWLVEALDLCPGVCHLVAGFGFSGKTVAAQAMAFEVAAALPVWGTFTARAGRVLHVDYEQGARLTVERYQRIARAHGCLPDEVRDRLGLVSRPQVYLDSREAEDVFSRECERFDLLVVDCLRAAAPRTDENGSDVRRVLDMLSRVSERTGCVPLVVHHARKPSQDKTGGARMAIRGSGALYDACGSVLVFEGEKGRPIRVSHEKARTSGRLADGFLLRVLDEEVGGNPRAGLAVRAERKEAPPPEAAAAAGIAASKERIRALFAQEPCQPSIETVCQQVGGSRAHARAAVELLIRDGEICAEGNTRNRKLVWAERPRREKP